MYTRERLRAARPRGCSLPDRHLASTRTVCRYTTERLWAVAPDATRVPISLVYRADLARLDGTDPLLLDAYGR